MADGTGAKLVGGGLSRVGRDQAFRLDHPFLLGGRPKAGGLGTLDSGYHCVGVLAKGVEVESTRELVSTRYNGTDETRRDNDQ